MAAQTDRKLAAASVAGMISIVVGILWGGAAAAQTVMIDYAYYGSNCPTPRTADKNHMPPTMAIDTDYTTLLKNRCTGKMECKFYLDHEKPKAPLHANHLYLGDPALACYKEFKVEFHCVRPNQGAGGKIVAVVPGGTNGPPEASKHDLVLSCTTGVATSNYGPNEQTRRRNTPARKPAEACPALCPTYFIQMGPTCRAEHNPPPRYIERCGAVSAVHNCRCG